MGACDEFAIGIVGAGMAGASLAAELSEDEAHADIVVLEAEHMPGYHATGRSAAFWEECYGGPQILPLTIASGPYLRDHGFLSPRGSLYLAREADEGAILTFIDAFKSSGAHFERIGADALGELVPGLKPQWDRGISQPRCADIDVAGLHAHYLSRARAKGCEVWCNARVGAIKREKHWHLTLADGREVKVGLLVNAAGAWADHVAGLAGIAPLNIQPFRRTVMQLRVDPPPPDALPLCLDISGRFYFKPEHGKLWLSPHDETPSEPVDAAPEEIDIALAIERLGEVVDWRIEALERKWAGLRSFAPDRLPVIGNDGRDSGFFWFAGQGGFGIQTAPAAARLAAQMIASRPRDEMTVGLDQEIYLPTRFN